MSSTQTASGQSTRQAAKSFIVPLILVTSLFFMWGMAHSLNTILIKTFKKSFELTDLQSGLIQSAFYMGYFFLAIPAASLMKRFGYKAGIITGLILYGVGALMFYPAAEVKVYALFLIALFIIASGLSFLETASNPYVAILGPAQSSEKRLNLSQAFNSLGAIMGIVIGRWFILSGVEYSPAQLAQMSADQVQAYYTSETQAVQIPYLVIGGVVLLWAVLISASKLPEIKTSDDEAPSTAGGWKELIKHKHFVRGVIALFFYVGAQVGTWSYLIGYAQKAVPGTSELAAANYLTLSMVCLMIGRFSSTFMMRYFQPNLMMALFAVVNTLLVLVAVTMPGLAGIYTLIASSYFMSLMFPTIFALSIKGLGNDTKLGSSVLIMAIIGGAILTALMGWISDISSITFAFMIPCVAYAVIAWYSLKGCHVVESK